MKKYNTKEKWRLKCFHCGIKVNSFPEFYRDWSGVYCFDCGQERMSDLSQTEYDAYEEDQIAREYKKELDSWKKHGSDPMTKPLDPEEKELKRSLIAKYGEW